MAFLFFFSVDHSGLERFILQAKVRLYNCCMYIARTTNKPHNYTKKHISSKVSSRQLDDDLSVPLEERRSTSDRIPNEECFAYHNDTTDRSTILSTRRPIYEASQTDEVGEAGLEPPSASLFFLFLLFTCTCTPYVFHRRLQAPLFVKLPALSAAASPGMSIIKPAIREDQEQIDGGAHVPRHIKLAGRVLGPNKIPRQSRFLYFLYFVSLAARLFTLFFLFSSLTTTA